jgi:hypothetical protein
MVIQSTLQLFLLPYSENKLAPNAGQIIYSAGQNYHNAGRKNTVGIKYYYFLFPAWMT